MKTLNKVTLMGNVGKDPQVKALPNGAVADFSLATVHRFKDKAGAWQEQTEWHNVVCYGRMAEIVREYVHKGAKLLIEGRIQTRSWDDKQSGQKKYRVEIVANDLWLLDGKGEVKGYKKSTDPTEIQDDDIPF